MSEVRPEVSAFARWMEAKLRRHDEDYVGWGDAGPDFLLDRLREETRELRRALKSGTANAIRSEAADVANFAMMLADNAEKIVNHWQDKPRLPREAS